MSLISSSPLLSGSAISESTRLGLLAFRASKALAAVPASSHTTRSNWLLISWARPIRVIGWLFTMSTPIRSVAPFPELVSTPTFVAAAIDDCAFITASPHSTLGQFASVTHTSFGLISASFGLIDRIQALARQLLVDLMWGPVPAKRANVIIG